jgi:hypothetical protein
MTKNERENLADVLLKMMCVLSDRLVTTASKCMGNNGFDKDKPNYTNDFSEALNKFTEED